MDWCPSCKWTGVLLVNVLEFEHHSSQGHLFVKHDAVKIKDSRILLLFTEHAYLHSAPPQVGIQGKKPIQNKQESWVDKNWPPYAWVENNAIHICTVCAHNANQAHNPTREQQRHTRIYLRESDPLHIKVQLLILY